MLHVVCVGVARSQVADSFPPTAHGGIDYMCNRLRKGMIYDGGDSWTARAPPPPGYQGILRFNKNRDRNESETVPVHFNESPAIATTSEERVVVGSQAMGFRKPVSGDRVRP